MKKTADPAQCLAQGLQALQLSTALQAPRLSYLSELQRWNAAYNLTAVREPVPMVIRHLLDSLAILPHLDAGLLPPEGRLLDVGSGAGLPGIPLALARPGWRVTVLDSNGKKARFLRHAQRTLGLANLEVIEARMREIVDRNEEITREVWDRTLLSRSSHLVEKHSTEDSGLEKWRCGHWRHTVRLIRFKRCLPSSQTTLSVVPRPMKRL